MQKKKKTTTDNKESRKTEILISQQKKYTLIVYSFFYLHKKKNCRYYFKNILLKGEIFMGVALFYPLLIGLAIGIYGFIRPFRIKLYNKEKNVKRTYINTIALFIISAMLMKLFSLPDGRENVGIGVVWLFFTLPIIPYVFIYNFFLTIRYVVDTRTRNISYIPVLSFISVILSFYFNFPIILLIPVLIIFDYFTRKITDPKEQEEIQKP